MIFLKQYGGINLLLSILILLSCKSSKNIQKLECCSLLTQELHIETNTEMKLWLNSNSSDCPKILNFINDERKSNDAKEYSLEIIKIKMSDSEYKIERLIELYYLF